MTRKEPNYIKEFLISEYNIMAGCCSFMLGALLSTGGLGWLPVLGFVTGELIALLYVPQAPFFRRRINKRFNAQQRDAELAKLIEALQAFSISSTNRKFTEYKALQARIKSLLALAADNSTAISMEIGDKIADTAVTYASLWLAYVTLDRRKSSTDLKYLNSKIAETTEILQQPATPIDLKKLQKALADYNSSLDSYNRIDIRMHSLEASMFSLVSSVEEMYQYVLSQPSNPEIVGTLEESLSRLAMEEELNMEFADVSSFNKPVKVVPFKQSVN